MEESLKIIHKIIDPIILGNTGFEHIENMTNTRSNFRKQAMLREELVKKLYNFSFGLLVAMDNINNIDFSKIYETKKNKKRKTKKISK